VRGVALPSFLLLGYGVAFGTAALGGSPIAFDDHPGQIYRVWHVVLRGFAPWAWNPGWWGGYPELQFYPPAFAYAGALLHHASLGALSVPAAYHALVWVAYLAPGVTTFAALTRVLGSGWLALPGAFVALTLSAGIASGVEGGVHWGMVAARLGWALIPLLLLALVGWIEGRAGPPPAGAMILAPSRPVPWIAAAVVAVVLLTHPAHVPTTAALVVLAAVGGAGAHRQRLARALAVLGIGAALTAFWSLPLVSRVGETRALAWGDLAQMLGEALTARPLTLVLVALSLLALRARPDAPGPEPPIAPRTAWVLARLPWVVAVVVAVDALVLDPLGLAWLPADRVVDGAWLGVVLAAALTTGRLLARVAPGEGPRRSLLSLAAVAGAVLLSLPGESLALWPRTATWASYPAIVRGLRLEELWAVLRNVPEGRVLFLRAGVPLVYGTAWYRPHTHATALTPIAGGRAIIHGTFTHPSPIAALVYRGSAGAGPIRHLAEQLDGRTLFGRALDELDTATLSAYADALGVSAVVALDEDRPRLVALADHPAFGRTIVTPPFLVHARTAPVSIPTEVAPGHWQVTLDAGSGGWTSARIAFYPLWRASLAGRPLSVRRGALGQLEVELPGHQATVDLVYSPGVPERAGVAVSLLALAAWLALALSHRLRRHHPRPDGAPP
jgi:hypothetical protein